MKLFKKLFGKKPQKSSKYAPNTLAEINESPDKRITELEPKKSEPKKTVKKSTKPTQSAKTKPAVRNNEPKGEDDKTNGTVAKPNSAKPTAKKSENEEKDKQPAPKAKKTAAAPKSSDKKTEPKIDEGEKDLSTAEPVTEVTEDAVEAKATRSGKFEIKKSKDGRYVFNLYASNSVIVATSQVYSSSAAAMNGIKSVIANAPTAPVEDQTLKTVTPVPFPKWEIYRDKGEQYRFRLCASNGSCVCHSQGYTSKTNCKKGIESIIKSSVGAEIVKAYINKEK